MKFYFGGTSLLIVVGVAMDTVQMVESQLIMRHYDGFPEEGPVPRETWLMARKIVILLGHPGAGKGTQAKEIMRRLEYSADFDRRHVEGSHGRQNGLGKEARKRMDAGVLVNDATVNGIVAERIVKEDCRKGFILDGYPRTVPQAETFQQYLDRTRSACL